MNESPSYFEIILSEEENIRIIKNDFRSCVFSRSNQSFDGYLEVESFIDGKRSSDFFSFETTCEDQFFLIFQRLTDFSQRVRFDAA
jgi:hypothetical protein